MGASRFGETFRGLPVRQVPEFSAIAAGALAFSGLARALVASVGTGTAFVMAARGEPARHLGGSGVGGGHGRSMGRRQYRRAAGRIGKVLGGKNKSGQPGRC